MKICTAIYISWNDDPYLHYKQLKKKYDSVARRKKPPGFPSWEVVVDLGNCPPCDPVSHQGCMKYPVKYTEASEWRCPRSAQVRKSPHFSHLVLLANLVSWLWASVRASGCDHSREVYVPLLCLPMGTLYCIFQSFCPMPLWKNTFREPGCGTYFLPFGNLHRHKRPQQPDLFQLLYELSLSLWSNKLIL